ncbi:MAG TPA: response regulator [Bryobacteraceae bacterium]|nr:response regulator [Bryobacteraceae bacterium]
MPRILLVEDNDLNCDMLSRRLARRGYEVVLASDGLEAVHQGRSVRPDLILMDMSLPQMDGWEATRLLKEDGGTRNIPVLALTAHALAGDRDRAIHAGCDDYDTKPVEFERLLGKIEALLRPDVSGQAGSLNVPNSEGGHGNAGS